MTDNKITNWTLADDAMVEHAIQRGATRRDLLHMLMAGGIASLAGTTILGRASSALAAGPVSGGSIKAAGWSSSTADTLDPAKASFSTDYVRCCAFYNRLTFLDQHGKTQMELAESVETKDAKVWTVKLRKDVTFHNGKTLSSADVVYSLKRHLDPAVGSKVNAIAKQMTGIKAVDPLTVEITLADANADLPTILAIHQFMIVADGTTDFAKANGTGAFTCQTFEPGVRSIGLKNKHYWKPQGPYLDSFEFIAISDDSARVNALLSGDIQLAAAVNARSMRLLQGQSSVQVSVTNSGEYTDINARLDLDPGKNPDFVTGLKYAIDRETITKSVLRGLGTIANDQPISPNSIYYNKDLKAKPFDPDKAKFHFQKAGVLGQSIPVVTSDAPTAGLEIAAVLQQSASQAGLKLDIQRVPADGYWSNYWLKSPLHFGNINPRPTPDILFSLLYASTAPWNESRYKSPKFDQMLIEARGMLDETKRTEIYHEMQRMISEEAGTVIPAFISNVDALSSKLKGLQPNPLGGMMGYAFAEYVWLEA